ncbi:MAG TPA: DUF4129 domain-containing protein [Microbacteriaceae bacterium]
MTALAVVYTLAGPRLGIPVNPDAPHAHDLLVKELSNPAYQAAKPTWIDLAAQAVQRWLASLFSSGSGVTGTFAVIGIVVLVCLLVGALIVFGVPRLNRSRSQKHAVLDADDARTAAELRRIAAASARTGQWNAAVIDLFRALTRGLAERIIVAVQPGTTAHEVAARASEAFPDLQPQLRAAAVIFDGVRYLGRAGTAEDYERLRDLDERLNAGHPLRHSQQELAEVAG